MTLDPTPALLENLYWITLIAVIVSSASGVLKAGFKQFDLFGVIIIAIATGLGGGSLREGVGHSVTCFWVEMYSGFATRCFLLLHLVVPLLFLLLPD